jgi:hypothetical protein
LFLQNSQNAYKIDKNGHRHIVKITGIQLEQRTLLFGPVFFSTVSCTSSLTSLRFPQSSSR